jgi:ornithine cyclodeaminase
MAEAIDAVAAAFAALSEGRAAVPLRSSVPLRDDAVALTMPASIAGAPYATVKVVSVAPRATPAVNAAVLVVDATSGVAVALVEGAALTALRTGAAGGLAARELARSDATVCALFGAGAQARTQLLGARAVRPLREVRVVTRERAHAEAFARWAAEQPALAGISVIASDPLEALRDATLVVTATSSPDPVFPGSALTGGAHVTAVGSFRPTMRELDEDTMRGAGRIVVDQRAAALAEAGELQGLGPDAIVEIGEIVARRVPGRRDERERTVFKSVGNAVQDLAVASLAYERAVARGLGEQVRWP